jgi:hypothetical protein
MIGRLIKRPIPQRSSKPRADCTRCPITPSQFQTPKIRPSNGDTPSSNASGMDFAGLRRFGWLLGNAAFGTPGTPNLPVGTLWNTSDIWIRRTFSYTGAALKTPALSVYHDEDAEVYLDGNLVGQLPLYLGVYGSTPIPSFVPGTHTLALHCHQTVAARGSIAGFWISWGRHRRILGGALSVE